MNSGRLTIDEIRTRPVTFSDSGKQISIEAVGCYICENDMEENPYVAKERARADAKRMLSEQANLHVKVISESKNGRLTRDEVHTISVTVLQIKDETFMREIVQGTTQYRCHIKGVLNETNIFDQLNPADKEKFQETVRRTIEIERESARLNSELDTLKKRYRNASQTERQKIKYEIKRNEEQFTANTLNERGLELYGRNDFDGAKEYFRKAIEVNANYASPWNGLGCIANYERNFDKAIEYCYKAVQIDPNYSAAWNNLGYAYNYKGDFERAVECYKKATELAPQDPAPLVNIGNVYDALNNYNEATNYYRQALELSPNYVNALNSLGYMCLQTENFDASIEYFNKALKLDKYYAATWNGLGYAYNQKKKFYKAIECCRKAVTLNPNYANAWNNLGYACSKVSRHEDSYTAYRNAVKFAPNIQLYRNNLAIAQERINSFKSL